MPPTPIVKIRSSIFSRRAFQMMPGFTAIGASVGAGGVNSAKDVRAVQVALNAVSPAAGGPAPGLAEDGLMGPKSIAAIRRIQTAWTRVVDGRVDPGGPTIRVLNRLAGAAGAKAPAPATVFSFPSGGAGAPGARSSGATSGPGYAPSPPPAPPASATTTADWTRALLRLELVQSITMPIVAVAVYTALSKLAQAQQHIGALRPDRPPTGAALQSEERLAFLFVAKHFRLHESEPTAALMGVQQVSTCFQRIMEAYRTRTTMTGDVPRFDRLYSLPTKPPYITTSDVAYCGVASGSQTPGRPTGNGDEVSDGIYLLPGFDAITHLHVSILLHELAHLSGGVSPQSMIVDVATPDWATFDAQTRQQRLINVQCYEYFGTEVLFGSASASSTYNGSTFALKPPFCSGGGRLAVPPALLGGSDPLAFPGGFA